MNLFNSKRKLVIEATFNDKDDSIKLKVDGDGVSLKEIIRVCGLVLDKSGAANAHPELVRMSDHPTPAGGAGPANVRRPGVA